MTLRVLLMAGSMENGGSEQQTLLLLQHLNRDRFAPELYLSRRCGDLLDRVPGDVPVHAFSDLRWQPGFYWPGRAHRSQVRHLRELVAARSIDVVYDRTFHMSLIAGGLPSRVPRVAAIVSPPDRDLTTSEHRFVTTKRRTLARSYRRARQVLCVSDAVRDSALRYYRLPAGRLTTLRSPVDRRRVVRQSERPLPDNGRLSMLADSRLLHVLCVGRMTREKGHDLLLDALGRLDAIDPATAASTRLWLVGDGPLREMLQQRCRETGWDDRVVFLGRLDTPAPLMRRCDLLIQPSRYEGLSNVLLEAFVLGLPVIATAVGGTPEMITDQENGCLVPPEDAAALAHGIAASATDRAARQAWAERASRRVAADFSLAGYLRRLERILQRAGGVTQQ
jgi:glycosyltransferase involved in cell wall biosynthesis